MGKQSIQNGVVHLGSRARWYVQPKPKSRWADPALPEYEPNWLVRFRVAGKSWRVMAKGFPVDGGGPVVKDLARWCREVIASELAALRRGAIDEVVAYRAAPERVWLSDVLEAHAANVPANNRAEHLKNGRQLRNLWVEALGLRPEEIEVSDRVWTVEACERWVRMYQEAGRRGWLERGAMPEDGWARLRADFRAGRVPGIDRETVATWNKGILSRLSQAATVFARGGEYLRGLPVVPEVRAFLSFKRERLRGLPVRRGHREFPPGVLEVVAERLPTLKAEDPRVWLLLQIMAVSAARPVSVRRLMWMDVEVARRVVHLRPTKHGQPVAAEVSAEMLDVMERLRVPGCESVLGCETATASEKVVRRLNAWLVACGVPAGAGEHKAYLLRHLRAQAEMAAGGLDAARAVLGHKPGSAATGHYVAPVENVIPFQDPLRSAAG